VKKENGTMPKFVYASPVLPGKTHLIEQVYAYKAAHPDQDSTSRDLNSAIGLEGCQAWLQRTSTRDFFIHGIETRNLEELFSRLQEQIHIGQSKAQWLRDFYLDIFGKDYSHPTATPDLEQLISIDNPSGTIAQPHAFTRGFVFPVRPNKVHDHREFSRQCMGEYRFRLLDTCRQFGITKLVHYLQKTPHQDYLVCYEERDVLTPEQEQKLTAARATSPSWQWFSSVLSAHTGVSVQNLEPRIEPLTIQPILVVSPLKALALSSI
jgi:hypothetical protein